MIYDTRTFAESIVCTPAAKNAAVFFASSCESVIRRSVCYWKFARRIDRASYLTPNACRFHTIYQKDGVKLKTIVIDPGHGGFDAGAVYNNRQEKTDNLNMALAVQRLLQRQGQRVIMTRNSDTYVPIDERSAISNRNNADILVYSICYTIVIK